MVNLTNSNDINELFNRVVVDDYFMCEMPNVEFIIALACEEFTSTTDHVKQLKFKLNQIIQLTKIGA
ncbi:hypothetical protein S144_12 [Shewanella sp. phage 1/44]|uniref:hypothetical protein n=1 Tax=Shewanella sp. phage 1/44 TaxID=1458862 RepID=UPI0004F714CD|nr:hypothetical protein S144_12 [Shewanella sp. phage 1/44]AHK11727.1 hypothetical protein S144_12 [Shewanella sp. phage 1/44]